MSPRRAVVTGIGVVAPGGIGTKAFWKLLTDGRTATRAISHFDASAYRSRIAAECDFDPAAAGLSPQEVLRMDRSAQFAVVAAREALADSGIDTDEVAPHRIGVSIGSAVGSTVTLEQQYVRVSDGGSRWVVDATDPYPHLYGALVPGALAAEVAWTAGAQGPVRVVSTGCTSGLDSVAQGAQYIEDGTADIVLAGATDAPISPITVACFDAIKATSPNNGDAAHASRPFDRDRDGFVLGEGAAVLILEEEGFARRRGARIYCEVAGYAQRSNAFHMTGLRPDGKELAEAVRVALGRARLPAQAVDYVNAHGSGTRQNDRHETSALKVSLGEHAYGVPVSSIKSMVGHSLGAIGALELAACALAIDENTIPPTANLEHPDPELGLDYVPKTAREQRTDTVLSVGSGFGGFQTAMVLTAPGRVVRDA
ncbi:beta-ketoacyl-[acyl-carrier-protein] synthase family protein [Streptomyces sp. NPDC058401]|uniref:beta-ketoacyl-[acyl-carrier-protein] synthase family protein n=1 Tax=Streptomyces sp. NPDC058401 TaxID=3346480 RepID=UPI00366A4DF1